jgi:hypothetical protein
VVGNEIIDPFVILNILILINVVWGTSVKTENLQKSALAALDALERYKLENFTDKKMGLEPQDKRDRFNNMFSKAVLEPRSGTQSYESKAAIHDALQTTLDPNENAELLFQIKNLAGSLTSGFMQGMIDAYRDAYIATLSALEPDFVAVVDEVKKGHQNAKASAR